VPTAEAAAAHVPATKSAAVAAATTMSATATTTAMSPGQLRNGGAQGHQRQSADEVHESHTHEKSPRGRRKVLAEFLDRSTTPSVALFPRGPKKQLESCPAGPALATANHLLQLARRLHEKQSCYWVTFA
jgi:hypothetical protein